MGEDGNIWECCYWGEFYLLLANLVTQAIMNQVYPWFRVLYCAEDREFRWIFRLHVEVQASLVSILGGLDHNFLNLV